MVRIMISAGCVASFAGLIFLSGCGETNPQPPAPSPVPAPAPKVGSPAAGDPDDVAITEADVKRPTDFADAVTRVKGYRNTIRDEIAAGRPTKAHRALDELDIVLNWLPEIARDGNVPKDRWESVNTTAQQIRELFNKVHTNIDAKQDPDYSSVSKDIDQAIGRLDEVTSATSPATKE
jgi:hypothetical protein